MLLEPELRGRLERLSLRSRRRVRGMWSGAHASTQHGDSMDFADYREYTPGDDFRRIDHALWARLGVVLVRLFEAEDELPVRLVIDRSASMEFGGKLDSAKRLAAMVSYLALAGGDRIFPYTTPGEGGRPLLPAPPARHLGAWPRLEGWLEGLQPEGQDRLGSAALEIAGQGSTRGPVVVISDLLSREWESALGALGAAGGGLILQVLAPEELDPDLAGDLHLVDAETGSTIDISTSTETMQRYRDGLDAFLANVAGRARRNGLDHVLVPATPDAVTRALDALAAQQVVR